MQTILGSGGAIGVELTKALKKYTNEIRRNLFYSAGLISLALASSIMTSYT
jgi:hypothetical protein